MTFQLKAPEAPVIYKNALFSTDRIYRYDLVRQWQANPDWVAFIGLNPSTADKSKDDATIRRCIGFARGWGFGGIHMINLFGFRSTDPMGLINIDDPIGPDNNEHIVAICRKVQQVIACWGIHGRMRGRGAEVLTMLRAFSFTSKVWNLGKTKDGYPKHPVRLAKKTQRILQWEK